MIALGAWYDCMRSNTAIPNIYSIRFILIIVLESSTQIKKHLILHISKIKTSLRNSTLQFKHHINNQRPQTFRDQLKSFHSTKLNIRIQTLLHKKPKQLVCDPRPPSKHFLKKIHLYLRLLEDLLMDDTHPVSAVEAVGYSLQCLDSLVLELSLSTLSSLEEAWVKRKKYSQHSSLVSSSSSYSLHTPINQCWFSSCYYYPLVKTHIKPRVLLCRRKGHTFKIERKQIQNPNRDFKGLWF